MTFKLPSHIRLRKRLAAREHRKSLVGPTKRKFKLSAKAREAGRIKSAEFRARTKVTPEIRKRWNQAARVSKLKAYYGLTVEQHTEMVKVRRGKCDICAKKPLRSLHIDHDHTTKVIRGLLCFKCNALLGFVNDDVNVLKSAIKYLRKK